MVKKVRKKRKEKFYRSIQKDLCIKENLQESNKKKTIFKNYGNKISKTDVEIYKRTKMCDF